MTLVTMAHDVATGPSPVVLDGIAHPGAALAIWDRDLPPGVREALALLDLDGIDDLSVELEAADAIDAALRTAGYPDDAVAPLAADIGLLVRRHAALTGQNRLAVRLEVIETDACRRFHADYVTLRLLCTYAGPGTQWQRIGEPDAIRHVPTGAVAVFKGRLLLDPPTVLHRSPPIMASGERRLMLVIDAARGAGRTC